MQKIKQKPLLLIIPAILLVGLIFLILLLGNLASRAQMAQLNIIVAPSFASVEINGKAYPKNGTYYLEPGLTVANISADGFIPREVNLNLISGEITTLALYLVPDNNDMSWYAEHPEEDMLLTTIGGITSSSNSKNYLSEYPIASILPILVVEVDPNTYEWTEFRIDGGVFDECTTKYCVKITDTTGGNKNRALNMLQSKGYNPADYEIIYSYTPVDK